MDVFYKFFFCIFSQIGGSLAWNKPKQNINKRFLNKTMIGTVIQNNIVMKSDKTQKQNTAELIKTSPALKSPIKEQSTTLNKTITKNKSTNNKIIISNKSRLNAYIKSRKDKELKVESCDPEEEKPNVGM